MQQSDSALWGCIVGGGHNVGIFPPQMHQFCMDAHTLCCCLQKRNRQVVCNTLLSIFISIIILSRFWCRAKVTATGSNMTYLLSTTGNRNHGTLTLDPGLPVSYYLLFVLSQHCLMNYLFLEHTLPSVRYMARLVAATPTFLLCSQVYRWPNQLLLVVATAMLVHCTSYSHNLLIMLYQHL